MNLLYINLIKLPLKFYWELFFNKIARGTSMKQNFLFLICLVFLLISCAPPVEEEEDGNTNEQTTAPVGGGVNDDDDASAISVDANTVKFDFLYDITGSTDSSINATEVIDADSFPARTTPSINTSSMITTLSSFPAIAAPGNGVLGTEGAFSENIQTPVDLSATRSHEVKLSSSAGTSCSSDFATACTLKSSDKSIAELTNIVVNSFDDTTANFAFKVDSNNLSAPVTPNIVKRGPPTNGAITERPWIVEAVELNGNYYAIARFTASGTAEYLVKINTSLDSAFEILMKSSASLTYRLQKLVAFNGNIYLAARLGTNSDYDLIKYDPTAKTFTNLTSASSVLLNPANFTVSGSNMYFSAQSNSSGHTKLYKIDSSNNIHQKSNTASSGSDNIKSIIKTENGIYLDIANPSNTGSRVIVRLNSDESVTPLIEIGSATFNEAVVVAGKTYIATSASTGLYRDNMDGSVDQPLKTGFTSASKPYPLSKMTELDGELYFVGGNPLRPFRFNSTDGVGVQLPKMNSLPAISEMISYNGAIYYAARDNDNNTRLFKQLPNGNLERILYNNGTPGDNPRNFMIYNDEFYFIANDDSGSPMLHRMNESGEIIDTRADVSSTINFLGAFPQESGIILSDKNFFDVFSRNE